MLHVHKRSHSGFTPWISGTRVLYYGEATTLKCRCRVEMPECLSWNRQKCRCWLQRCNRRWIALMNHCLLPIIAHVLNLFNERYEMVLITTRLRRLRSPLGFVLVGRFEIKKKSLITASQSNITCMHVQPLDYSPQGTIVRNVNTCIVH